MVLVKLTLELGELEENASINPWTRLGGLAKRRLRN